MARDLSHRTRVTRLVAALLLCYTLFEIEQVFGIDEITRAWLPSFWLATNNMGGFADVHASFL